MTEKERQFILELTELTRKYGIAIGGCGCCGSPSLEEVETPDDAGYDYSDRLRWRLGGPSVIREHEARREILNWPALEIGDDPSLIPTFAMTDGTAFQRQQEISTAWRQLQRRGIQLPSNDELVAQILANRRKDSA